MNLDLVNKVFHDVKNNNFVQGFIKELQNHLENINIEKEDISLLNPIHNGSKIITKYRDKMYVERANILNNYAKQTLEKGQMYYIYSKNSKMKDVYNSCICKEGESNKVFEISKDELPQGSKTGSILRKNGDYFSLDEEATIEIENKIYNMKSKILEKQEEFLKNKRLEGHVYEISEKDIDRVCLFDITNGSNEEIEEIEFPIELLKDGKEGDLFVFRNGKYQKYYGE